MSGSKDPLLIKEARRKSNRGGARKGAGRPEGTGSTASKRSRQVANEIAEGRRFVEEVSGADLPKDATPLDVMLMAMRASYKLGGSIAAAPFAEKCAPYIHARISQMELKNSDDKPFVLQFTWADEENS